MCGISVVRDWIEDMDVEFRKNEELGMRGVSIGEMWVNVERILKRVWERDGGDGYSVIEYIERVERIMKKNGLGDEEWVVVKGVMEKKMREWEYELVS